MPAAKSRRPKESANSLKLVFGFSHTGDPPVLDCGRAGKPFEWVSPSEAGNRARRGSRMSSDEQMNS